MAEHNFAAGVEMTMTSIVKNYLRWFKLQTCKRAMRTFGVIPELRGRWIRVPRASEASVGWEWPPELLARQRDRMQNQQECNLTGKFSHVKDARDSFAWSNSRALGDQSNGDVN
jgi:hypothetical protein